MITTQRQHADDLRDAWHMLRTHHDELCRRILTLETALHRVLEDADELDAATVQDHLQRVRRNVVDVFDSFAQAPQ